MIEHSFYGTQLKYGYIWWFAKDDEKFKQIFPNKKVLVYLEDEKIGTRKVDWKKHRISIGPHPMNRHFKKSDTIVISSIPSGAIKIRKK